MKSFLTLVVVFFAFFCSLQGASVVKTSKALIMENKFIKVQLNPRLGGKAISFIKKNTNTEFCGKFGAMIDRLLVAGKRGQNFENKPVEYKIVHNLPGKAVVRFSCRGKSPGFRKIYFTKTVFLYENSNSLKVEICFENKDSKNVAINYWVANNFQNKTNTSHYFAPMPDGIYKAWNIDNKGAGRGVSGQDKFIYNPPRAWSGMVNPDGTGIVAVTENKYLNNLYNFLGGVSTVEWMYNSITLKPGEKWTVEYTLIPFSGLKTISGASSSAVLGISAPIAVSKGKKCPASLAVVSTKPLKGTVTLSATSCFDKKTLFLKKASLNFSAAKTLNLPFDIKVDKNGTFLIKAKLSSKNAKSVEAFAKTQAGSSAGKFQIPSDVKNRIGKSLNTFNKKSKLSLDAPEFYVADDSRVAKNANWAKPYVRGRINALFLLKWEQKEVIELADRLSLNYVASRTPERLGSELSRGFDVLLIGGFNWNNLPTAVQKTIITAVKNGMGLVFASGTRKNKNSNLLKIMDANRLDVSEITEKVPIEWLKVLQKKNSMLGAQIGKGRILFVDYERKLRSPYATLTPIYKVGYGYGSALLATGSSAYEYSFCLLIKSILWTSDKMPLQRISFEGPPNKTKGVLRLPVAFLNPSGNTYPWNAELRIRGTDGKIVYKIKRNEYLKSGKNVDNFIIPSLPDGTYGAELMLYDNWGRCVDFGIKMFDVTSPVLVNKIDTDKPAYKSGEEIECKIKIRSQGKRKIKVRLTLNDIDDYQLALKEKDYSLSRNGVISFKLPTVRTEKRTHYIVAELFHNKKLLSKFKKKIIIEKAGYDEFLLTSYSAAVKPSAQLGMNCAFDKFETASELDLPYMPWYAQWVLPLGFGDGKKLKKAFVDWADPKVRTKIAQGVKKRTREGEVKYRPPAGMLIDEFRPLPSVLAAASKNFKEHNKSFRKFLKNMYGTIEKLNAQWGTSYKSFDNIIPWSEKQLAARIHQFWKDGKINYSPSFDHSAYWEFLFADYIDFINTTMCSIYPDAKLGLSGCNGYLESVCFDYWQLVGENKCKALGMYSGYLRNVVGSFKNKDAKLYYWSGYDRTVSGEKKIRMDLWQNLFENGDGVFYYACTVYAPAFSPDWRTYLSGKWIKEESDKIVKGGIANLIKTSVRVSDKIAILYSPRSLHAARLGDVTGENSGQKLYSNEQSSMLAILKDIGFQPSYISYAQVEKGILTHEKCKVLILPYSQSISDKEADQIKKYVKAGGILIATIKPGIYDEHGKSRKNPCLDQIFGVSQKNFPSYKMVSISNPNNKVLNKFSFDAIQGETQIKLTTGKALAAWGGKLSKACIVNDYGKGKAIFLNFSTSNYQQGKSGGVGGELELIEKANQKLAEGIRKFYRSLFAYAGLKPVVTISSKNGNNTLPYDIFRFKKDNTLLLGVLTGTSRELILESDKCPVKINLPEDYFIYDLIAEKFLGKHKVFEDTITDGKAKLYALLKKEVKDITLSISTSGSIQSPIQIEINLSDKTSSSAIISVKTPAGKIYIEKKITIKNGVSKLKFSFPLNAENGIWTIEAQDVISKKKDFVPVKIKKGEIK